MEEKDSFPDRQRDNLHGVEERLSALNERYGDRLTVSVVNPRSIAAFIDNIRYGVRPGVPVWVLDRKKIYEGLPDPATLQNTIDEKMGLDHSL
ncbi:MAG: hypothetical protein LBS00_00365 [Synergistaceae bacterium]|nr:hypothetical protein [Synergistaceae bacterium]